MSKHSPGPWQAIETDDCGTIIASAQSEMIATMQHWRGQGQNMLNAAHIVACVNAAQAPHTGARLAQEWHSERARADALAAENARLREELDYAKIKIVEIDNENGLLKSKLVQARTALASKAIE